MAKKRSTKPTRHDARHQVLHILYAADVRNVNPYVLMEPDNLPLDQTLMPYAKTVVTTIMNNLDAIDDMIIAHLHKWDLYRLAHVDRNLLRMATAEMMYIPDAPTPVAITEAVKIASELSGKESPKFINGVLGAIGRRIDSDKQEQDRNAQEQASDVQDVDVHDVDVHEQASDVQDVDVHDLDTQASSS